MSDYLEEIMKKQPERKAKTKQALRNSFWKLYEQKPIEKITIHDITTDADLYRTTFYEYYPDVYAVLEEIEDDVFQSYLSFVARIADIRSLQDGMTMLVEFYTENAEYLAVLLGSSGDPVFQKKIKNYIKSAIHERLHIPIDGQESEILIEMGSAAVIAMLNYWYEHRDTMSIEDIINISSGFLHDGPVQHFEKWLINNR